MSFVLYVQTYHRSRFVKADTATVTHCGACHCQSVHFTVKAPAVLRALDCASKIRYPHVTVPSGAFEVVQGADRLVHCTVRNRHNDSIAATCYFCAGCGVHVYRDINISTCHVNTDLIDERTVQDISVSFYDGWPGMVPAGCDTGRHGPWFLQKGTQLLDAVVKPAASNSSSSSASSSAASSSSSSSSSSSTVHSSSSAAGSTSPSLETPSHSRTPRFHRPVATPSPRPGGKHYSPVPVQNILVSGAAFTNKNARSLLTMQLTPSLPLFPDFVQAVQFYGAYANLDRSGGSAFATAPSQHQPHHQHNQHSRPTSSTGSASQTPALLLNADTTGEASAASAAAGATMTSQATLEWDGGSMHSAPRSARKVSPNSIAYGPSGHSRSRSASPPSLATLRHHLKER
jgi:hypothetical protein